MLGGGRDGKLYLFLPIEGYRAAVDLYLGLLYGYSAAYGGFVRSSGDGCGTGFFSLDYAILADRGNAGFAGFEFDRMSGGYGCFELCAVSDFQ